MYIYMYEYEDDDEHYCGWQRIIGAIIVGDFCSLK